MCDIGLWRDRRVRVLINNLGKVGRFWGCCCKRSRYYCWLESGCLKMLW